MADHIAAYQDYLEHEKHSYPNTVSSYIRDLHQFHAYLKENVKVELRRVKKDQVQAYADWMLSKGKSAASVTRSLVSIKSFYAFLMSNALVKVNPVKGVATAKIEKKYPQILTSKEVELFLEQPQCVDPKGYRDHAMLELLYATGIRVTELIQLDVEDVNLELGTIRCAGSRKSRSIPLYPGAIRALHNHGLRVPRDVSVMGFDGLPLSSYMVPQLSTVYQSAQVMARRGVEILLDRIENGGEPCWEFVPYSLYQRESTRRIDDD